MELAFDDRKLLLPGVHEVSLEVVKEHFGQFQRSDRRMTLFAKLTEYLEAVRKAGCGQSVVIDGSFVMGCVDEPDDIDLLLVLPVDWDDAADLRPYQYNLVSRRAIRKAFGLDVFIAKSGSAREAEWIRHFGGVNTKWREKWNWPADIRKGILRVLL
ncbi:MAG: hypothetical protein HY289_02615 [Planctomycetes bacterium]|nr:hypothetical protein [Planctomycetota bacterium]